MSDGDGHGAGGSGVAGSHEAGILAEQVYALFRSVVLGVTAAALAALLMAGALARAGVVEPRPAMLWSGFVVLCAGVHLALAFVFGRRRTDDPRRLRGWARVFTAICLLEGLGWGFASTGMVADSDFVVALIAIAVTIGATAGAITAFGSYLPAYLAFIWPANIPFMMLNLVSAEPLREVSGMLLGIFIVAMTGLGVLANRSFRELVGLRLKTEELAADLRRQKDVAEAANRAKSAFLAAASHDLRQPVHAIGLFIGALKAIPMADEGRAIVRQMEESNNATDGLFNALLDISRLEAGVVDVNPVAFPIGPLIERVSRDHVAEAQNKGLSLTTVASRLVVMSDPVLVERILRNLVENAVRYTRRGAILVGCRRSGDNVRLCVIDTGPGIAAGEQGKIFAEYYQLGNPERDRTRGLGLGLAIVRRLSDLLGCPLRLSSAVGRGSCFEIVLPRTDEATTRRVMERQTESVLATGLIAVVDDEQPILEAMTALLTSWGHQVVTASSGDEALALLSTRHDRPDLLICDYRLRQHENGIEVIERLRSEYNHAIPALLISGDTAPDRLAEAEASALVLLHKPVPNGRLRAAINNLMRSRETAGTDA